MGDTAKGVWIGVAFFVVMLCGYAACGVSRTSGLPKHYKGLAELEQGAEQRDLARVAAALQRDGVAAAKATDAVAVAWEPPLHSVYSGCGRMSPRPMLLASAPHVGKVFAIEVDALGGRTANNRYDWPPTWVGITTAEPLAEPIELEGGCPLWIDPLDQRALVWFFTGTDGHSDALMSRSPGARSAFFRVEMPREAAGLRGCAQVVTWDKSTTTFATSPLVRVQIGR